MVTHVLYFRQMRRAISILLMAALAGTLAAAPAFCCLPGVGTASHHQVKTAACHHSPGKSMPCQHTDVQGCVTAARVTAYATATATTPSATIQTPAILQASLTQPGTYWPQQQVTPDISAPSTCCKVYLRNRVLLI